MCESHNAAGATDRRGRRRVELGSTARVFALALVMGLLGSRAQADVDTSGDAVEQSFAKLLRIVTPLLGERQL